MLAEAGEEAAVLALEVGAHDVHRRRADELGDEEVHGPVVERLRHVELLQHAVAHHRHAVAEGHRLDLVVRDVDRRHGEGALDARDLGAHLDAELRVEVRERLVHEERLRLADDRPTHRDPLALAAGKRPRPLAEDLLEPQDTRRVANPPVDLLALELSQLQPEGHVLVRGHVRVERVVLEDHRDVAVLRREVVHDLAADANDAVADRLEPGHHPERARLPAARGPDEDDELAVADLEVEVADRMRPVRIDLVQLFELDLGHRAPSFS